MTLLGSLFTVVLLSAIALLPAPARAQLIRRVPGNADPKPQAIATPEIQPDTLLAGVPLRVEIDHAYPLKAGTRIEGHLIAPVYRIDHELLPVNTPVSGMILATHPVARNVRAAALLDGDFTPLAIAEIHFDTLTMPDGASVPISTDVTERTSSIVRMSGQTKRPSLKDQAIEQFKQRKQDALDTVLKPGKADRAKRYLYSQLPYHPQRIWAGTEYDADLTAPAVIPEKAQPAPIAVADLKGSTPTGQIEARLTNSVDSRSAKQGEVVEAVLSKPLLMTPSGQTREELVLPEGTRLTGTVLQAKPARWFARNGKLRFTFRQIEMPEIAGEHTVHGQITAAETNGKQNVSIDSEGGAKAAADQGKYLAPLALGVLAAASMDDDGGQALRGSIVSNGFGLIARVIAVSVRDRNVNSGFAYYALAKSVYKRWIAKGKEVSFPKDTRLQIDLSNR